MNLKKNERCKLLIKGMNMGIKENFKKLGKETNKQKGVLKLIMENKYHVKRKH